MFQISVCNIGIHLWALFTSMHSAMAVKSANLAKLHGRRLATRASMDMTTLERGWLGLMTDASDLCSAGLGLHWLLKIFVAYPLPSERSDNALDFPSICWNDNRQILISARPRQR